MPVKSGNIQIRWPKGSTDLYDLVIKTVVATKAFQPATAANLYQPAHGPIHEFYSKSWKKNTGDKANLLITFSYWGAARTPAVSDFMIVDADAPKPKALGPPLPIQLGQSAQAWADAIRNLLEGASISGHSKVEIDFVKKEALLELRRFKVVETPKPQARKAAIPGEKAAKELLHIVSSSDPSFSVGYAASVIVRGSEWHLESALPVVMAKPVDKDAKLTEDEEGEDFLMSDEGDAIINDINNTRRIWLKQAATMIAEQDPTRLDNILWSVGPLAVMKVGKVAKLARFSKLSKASILGKIRVPKAVQLVRKEYHVAAKLNPKLVERSLDLRKTKYGVEFKDFRKYNISAWEVKVNGEARIIDSGNVPISEINKIHGKGATDVGLHSEGMIAEHLRKLQSQGHEVKVVQIYTERPPCKHCAELLQRYSEAPVFHSLSPGEGARAERLMRAYGITP